MRGAHISRKGYSESQSYNNIINSSGAPIGNACIRESHYMNSQPRSCAFCIHVGRRAHKHMHTLGCFPRDEKAYARKNGIYVDDIICIFQSLIFISLGTLWSTDSGKSTGLRNRCSFSIENTHIQRQDQIYPTRLILHSAE
jgi:hypothetical protein